MGNEASFERKCTKKRRITHPGIRRKILERKKEREKEKDPFLVWENETSNQKKEPRGGDTPMKQTNKKYI
jgi:hypothetical protein